MTERGARHVFRDEDKFVVGPSSMRWKDDELFISINEHCTPLPTGLRGKIRIKPTQFYNSPVMLDTAGKHFWQAVAPQASISAEFENPKLSWRGIAYHDMNWGTEPIEEGFKSWTWARANTSNGTQVIYDVERRDGSNFSFSHCLQNGELSLKDVPPSYQLSRGFWGMRRPIHSEDKPRLIAKLEDAPFYSRNHVEITLNGETCEAVHESLSLDRFVPPVVQMMLPFRMPRIG